MLGASIAHRNIAEETGKNRDRSKRAGAGHSRTMQDNPQALLPKPQLPVVPLPGSRPLSNARHEHYCRLRSLL